MQVFTQTPQHVKMWHNVNFNRRKPASIRGFPSPKSGWLRKAKESSLPFNSRRMGEKMDSCFSHGNPCVVKCKQPRPRFEISSPIPFYTVITIILNVSPAESHVIWHKYLKIVNRYIPFVKNKKVSRRKNTAKEKLKAANQQERIKLWKQHFENLLGNAPKITHEPITRIISKQLDIKLGPFTQEELDSVLRKI